MNKLDFNPKVFLDAIDRLPEHYYSCFTIRSNPNNDRWDASGTFARGFYEKLFGIVGNTDFILMLWRLGYETVDDDELENIQLMCLYLAYLVSSDIERGKIDNFV